MNREEKYKISDEAFKACNSDEDRVKLMLYNVDEFPCIQNQFSFGRKSSEESVKFRKSGNVLLNSIAPDLEEVLKLYSTSILYALPGSEELSLAYANRSAILFRGKYYEECLEDISRALETGYPDSLKPKLLIRKVICTYALTGNVDFESDEGLIEARALVKELPATNKIKKMVEDTLNDHRKITSIGKQVKKTRPMYQPEMKGRNSHLPGASDAIALRYSEEYGRHLVATRDISSGEVLLMERSYATIIDDEWIYCICSHCAKKSWNGIPCDYCVHAMFCSAECKRAAWKEYHDVECEILGFEMNDESVVYFVVYLSLRLTVKAIKEAGSVEALRKRLRELDSVKASDVEIPIKPNSYETFYIMYDNPERLNTVLQMSWAEASCILTYFLAVRTNLLGKKVTGSLQVVKNSEHFLFVAGLVLKNMRIAQNRLITWKVDEDEIQANTGIFTIMPVSSFFNNRCYDATEPYRINEEVIVVTPVPITKGDQVFAHYYKNYKTFPMDSWKSMFNVTWQFDCNCLACKENWSTSTSTFWIDQNLSPRIVEALRNEIRKVKWPSLEGTKDPMTLILLEEQLCRLMDFIYPRVKKPCKDVEILIGTICEILTNVITTVNPRFVDEYRRSDHQEYELSRLFSILKNMYSTM